MKYILIFALIMCVCACAAQKRPSIVPGIEKKTPATHPLGIIGEVEPVYFLPMKTPLSSRIDTGAETSSLDASKIKTFERDGEKWVSFVITNRDSGEQQRFEKPVVRKSKIVRIEDNEKRYIVHMDIKMGSLIMNEEFSLADRSKFSYQVLIGRNILNGRAIVDPALSNTLN